MRKMKSKPSPLALGVVQARRRLAAAVSAVKITPEVEEQRLSKLTERAHKAKHAKFLDKYRVAR